MSQQNRPVPLPRIKINLPSHSMDDGMLRSSSTPQSQRYSRDSSAQRVLPRSLSIQNDTVYGRQQMVGRESIQSQPPPPPARPPKEQFTTEADSLDETSSSDEEEMKPWREIIKELQLRGSSEIEIINVIAKKLYKAIQKYIQLISKHGGDLKSLIHELNCISDNLDKFSKRTKIAGITGGASTAAGGVAAAAGVILAPFTAGVSLALTVVGAGVAAAGGVTGASAAIVNKANLNQDKKKIEKTLNDFSVRYDMILTCLRYINEGMDLVKKHGVAFLNKTIKDPKVSACVVNLANGEASAMASGKSSSASGMLKGFAVGMDFYFTQDKNGQKLKKGLESKLAKNIRKLADDLDKGLEELMNINDVFSKNV